MVCRVTVVLLVTVLTASGLVPGAARGASDPDRVPAWVSGTVIGAFVIGGALYMWHRTHGDAEKLLAPRARVEELTSHLATPEEKEELKRVTTEADATAFLDRFYARRDPSPGTPRNEFRDAQLDRYREANDLYGTRPLGWGGDRRRVHFVYGPPDEQRTLEVRGQVQPAERWTSAEIWVYNTVAGSNALPQLLRDPQLFDRIFREQMPVPGRRLFLFVNAPGEGSCRLGFSTEAGEAFDHSIYQSGANGE